MTRPEVAPSDIVTVAHALDIQWPPVSGQKVRCPFPDHEDRNPSFRIDPPAGRWFCTCGNGDVFDLVMRKKGGTFADARRFVESVCGVSTPKRSQRKASPKKRTTKSTKPPKSFTAIAVLNPGENAIRRGLYESYMAARLKVERDEIIRPTTPIAEHKRLPYWHDNKEIAVLPGLVLGQIGRDGGVHACRIWLDEDGTGKARLTNPKDDKPLDVKKSCTAQAGDNTAGRCVRWGQRDAPHEVLTEGAENAQAIAQAFSQEISQGAVQIAAALTTSGLKAYRPYAKCERLTIVADRDEGGSPDDRGWQVGERAARRLADKLAQQDVELAILVPGKPGTKCDFLDRWLEFSPAVARKAVLQATPLEPVANDEPKEPESIEPNADEKAVEELAALTKMEYDRRRESEADRLGVRVTALDEDVKAHRRAIAAEEKARKKEKSASAGEVPSILFKTPEPWPDLIDGAVLLDEIAATFSRYLALPNYAASALALWVINSHCLDVATFNPRLFLKSPERRCGKTRTLGLLERLCPCALPAANISMAAIFRVIDDSGPTLLLDECDTFLHTNPEIIGVLNSGHERRVAQVIRCVGDNHEPTAFKTWSPIALAAIGRIEGTLMDRSIIIPMRRRRRDEVIAHYRSDKTPEIDDLLRKATSWAAANQEQLRNADPEMPSELDDRARDNWRLMLGIADYVGQHWPTTARAAATIFSRDDDKTTTSILLLADIKAIFDDLEEDRIPSSELIAKLNALSERPWGDWKRGRGLSPRTLVNLLEPFGVVSTTVRFGPSVKDTKKGYTKNRFMDAWSRYLPNDGKDTPSFDTPSYPPESNVTTSQVNQTAAFSENQNVTPLHDVTYRNAENPRQSAGCDVVTLNSGEVSGTESDGGINDQFNDTLPLDDGASDEDDDTASDDDDGQTWVLDI